MRILLVGPTSLEGVGGNITTITRLRDGLRARGHDARYLSVDEAFHPDWRPDVVHAFHALHAGGRAAELADRLGIPFVVTLTGTDLRPAVPVAETAEPRLAQTAARAAAVIVFDDSMRDEMMVACPQAEVHVIPQGLAAWPPGDAERGRRLLRVGEADVVFLMVAGLRYVKRPHLPLEPLGRLRVGGAPVAYRIVGPALDEACTADLDARLAAAGPWARWIGPVAHSLMPHVYAASHVVVNASKSEGMSGALLEGMACGLPALAADIPANRAIVTPGLDGLLFDDDKELLEGARLLLDANTRAMLGEAARSRPWLSADEEVRAYLSLYERLPAIK